MKDPESLRRKIAEEEARLAGLEKERAESLARLKELKKRLTTADRAPTPPKPVPSDRPPFPSKAPPTRPACRPEDSFSSGWLTLSESIRAAFEIPFEVDLVEKDANAKGVKDREGR